MKVALFLVLVSLLGCEAKNPQIVDVGPKAAAQLIQAKKVRVLDVRTQEEFDLGHVEGAVLTDIRADSFAEQISALPTDVPYLVHCAAGVENGRSRQAVNALKKHGVKEIYHLEGGYNAWAKAQIAPVKSSAP